MAIPIHQRNLISLTKYWVAWRPYFGKTFPEILPDTYECYYNLKFDKILKAVLSMDGIPDGWYLHPHKGCNCNNPYHYIPRRIE